MCFLQTPSPQSLKSQYRHPLAGLPALILHRKNSKSPQRIKLACRGGLLNQQQTAPTISPRSLRSVSKELSALLSQISLGINFQFYGHDQGSSTHTHQEILLLCNIFFFACFSLCNSLWGLCVGVLSGWAVFFFHSTNVCGGPLLSPPPPLHLMKAHSA